MSEEEAPVLPQEEIKEEQKPEPVSQDIQKELEAKFDELFGAFDENNEEN